MADENNVASFTISLEGDTTGNLWYGKFEAKKRLSLRDQLNRDKIRRELLGTMGGSSDDRALSIAFIVSELTVRLVKFPEWWKEMDRGLDMEDGNIVSAIYDEVDKIEKETEAERKKRAEAAKAKIEASQAEKAKDK